MNITTISENLTYSNVEGILTQEENDYIYGICKIFGDENKESIEDSSFFTEGMGNFKVHNKDIKFPTNDDQIKFYNIMEKVTQRLDIDDVIKDYPKKENFQWHYNLCISSTEPLYPHTDEIEGLKKYGLENNIDVSQGIYKGVIYIGDPNIDYTNYGTRFYENSNPNSQIGKVKFVPTNACLFKTSINSYHGTDFKTGLPNNRYFVTIQYYEKN
jgi:hypothetical protein